MNLNNFTIKASEVLQQASSSLVLMPRTNYLSGAFDELSPPIRVSVEYLLKKNNVTIPVLETKLDELIGNSFPQNIGRRSCAGIGP